MRKQFFISLGDTRIHIQRWKGLVKITCFDEQDQILGLNHEAQAKVILNYLILEGFLSEDENVNFTFCENIE